jgi:flagellar protein FlaG
MEKLTSNETISSITAHQLKPLEKVSRDLASLSNVTVEKSNSSNRIEKTTQVRQVEEVNRNLQTSALRSASENRATLTREVKDRIDDVLAYLNNEMRMRSRRIQFTIDRESSSAVITVVRADTGAVIRQIPSQQILDLSNNLDQLKGLIFDEAF